MLSTPARTVLIGGAAEYVLGSGISYSKELTAMRQSRETVTRLSATYRQIRRYVIDSARYRYCRMSHVVDNERL